MLGDGPSCTEEEEDGRDVSRVRGEREARARHVRHDDCHGLDLTAAAAAAHVCARASKRARAGACACVRLSCRACMSEPMPIMKSNPSVGCMACRKDKDA